MKNKRQEVIVELIQNNVLTTQDELQEALLGLGFKVTQSTVSRDIKELRIVKSQDASGVYRYHIATKNNNTLHDRNHFEEIFAKSCIDVVYSINTVIIKCYAGMASSVCVALENLFSNLILGSLAGDDTIFAITSGEQDSIALTEKIKKLI
jgi:transcriptional regulator of arginine metabolism